MIELPGLLQRRVLFDRELRRAEKPLEEGGGYIDKVLNLADLSADFQQIITSECWGVLVSKRGTNPGARLDVRIAGDMSQVGPGDWWLGHTKVVELRRGTNCPATGSVRLRLFRDPTAFFREEDLAPSQLEPQVLLGSRPGGVITGVTVAQDTAPTGASPTGSFDCAGWSTVRVICEASAGFVSGTLQAYFQPQGQPSGSEVWYPQEPDAGAIALGDSLPSGGTTRVVLVDVIGPGKLFLMPSGIDGSPATFKEYVEGLR